MQSTALALMACENKIAGFMLYPEQPNTFITSKLYISRTRKKIRELTEADCLDAETFHCLDREIWNGF